jgi:hypothetical protein
LRAIGALVSAAAAVTVLAGCQTKVGQAAVVNGTELSDSKLSQYVTKQAVPFSAGTTQITPKVFAVESWIDTTLFEQAIAKHGGPPTSAERTQYEGLVFSGSSPDQIIKTYTDKGFTAAMAQLRIREQADFLLLAHRLHPKLDTTQIQQGVQGSLGNEVIGEIAKLGKNVTVSARYGKWDAKNLAMTTDVGSGLPSFITFGTNAAADANQ